MIVPSVVPELLNTMVKVSTVNPCTVTVTVIVIPGGPEEGVTVTVTVMTTHGPYAGQAVISGAADAGAGTEAAVIVSAEKTRATAARHLPTRDATAIPPMSRATRPPARA